MGRKRSQQLICLHCGLNFCPDYRNKGKQRYCSSLQCRAASKAASQKAWLGKPENREYFRGPDNVDRVRQWRRNNPGYSRGKSVLKKKTLQDHCPRKSIEIQRVKKSFPETLQDHWFMQPSVIIGLISSLCGSALQDDIVRTARQMYTLGCDVINNPKGGFYVPKTSHSSPETAQGSQAIQLGGSQAGQ